MANSFTTSSNFTDENHSSVNAPAWIVPTDSASTSDKTILISNNDTEVPNYNSCATPSASEIDDLPPNYFDITIVHNGSRNRA
jgi:hypothetical protein